MPECLVDKDGNSFHSDKSDLLKIIAPKTTQVSPVLPEKADGLVIDLSVVIRSEAAVIKTSENSYADFAKHILSRLERMAIRLQAKRLDIVADT